MSKEIQIREGNLIASFDLENEDGDIDFCKLLKVSRGVADEIGMFVDYVATNKIIKDQSKKISDLEAKLAESEKEREFLKEENKINKKDADYYFDEYKLCKHQLADKDKAIENWQTMYKSVVQTCHNDKEEIERLNKQLETQEHTITNLVEDNRASQEWYKKQLADTEAQNKRVLEKLDLIVRSNQELEKQLAEKEKEIKNLNNRILISQLQAPKEQILNILGSQCIQYNPDQDKISFALEQLEKVKEYIKTNLMSFQKVPIIQEIDNQIKQLKEMK